MLQQLLGAAAGAAASASHKWKNSLLSGAAASVPPSSGQVRMLLTALDYKATSNPLTCTKDGHNMQVLARACGVEDMTVMYDEQCTKSAVLGQIANVGRRCGPGDVFVFYYSGHGTSMRDISGDEADGKDEAFCFVDERGQITYESCLIDDDFAKAVTKAVPRETQIVILTDCCHSGTIADFDASVWAGRRAVSIAGCLDGQTSGDMGKGGIFTHSMLMAIDKLNRAGNTSYSMAKLYNATVTEDQNIFNSAQDICLESNSGSSPQSLPWPLIPKRPYKAPLSQAAEHAAHAAAGGGGPAAAPGGAAGGGGAAIQALLQSNPNALDQLGISPQMAHYIASQSIDIIPDDYQSKLEPYIPLCFSLLGMVVEKLCSKE